MNKVNIIGMKWVHKYAKVVDGIVTNELKEVECTEAEYLALATSTPPVIDGYQWVASVERHKMNTPSGDLEDGQYYEHTVRVVKIPFNNPCSFDVVKKADAGINPVDIEKIVADPGLAETWVVKEKE